MTGYFQDVDDIVHDQSNTNIEETFNRLNELQSSIKFAMENELDNSIHFLDPAKTQN
jgi:hypothetical protein